jgi:hypothetical protein
MTVSHRIQRVIVGVGGHNFRLNSDVLAAYVRRQRRRRRRRSLGDATPNPERCVQVDLYMVHFLLAWIVGKCCWTQ